MRRGNWKGYRSRGVEALFYLSAPLAALVTTPYLARALGPADRGLLGVGLAVASVAVMMGALGQAETYLSNFRQGEDSYRTAVLIARVCGIVAGFLAFATMVGLGLPISVAILLSLWVPLLGEANIWRSAAIGRSNTNRPALANAIASLIRLILIPTLAILSVLSLEVAASLMQGALFVGSLLAMGLYATRVGPHASSRASLESTRAAAKSGLRFVLFGAITAITLRSDVIVMQVFSSPTEVGTYAAAIALAQSGLALSGYFRGRAQVAIISSEPLRGVVRETAGLLMCGALAVVVVIAAAEPIADVLFGPEYLDAAVILRVVALAAVGQMLLDLVQGLLIVQGQSRQLVIIAGVGASIALIGLFALVPVWAGIGAAVAVSVATIGASSIGLVILLRSLRTAG